MHKNKRLTRRSEEYVEESLSWQECFTGFLQGKDEPYKLLGSMRDGDVVVFPLGTFLGEICSK